MRSISCFLPHQKILILAKVTAGQSSALMCNFIACAIFQSRLLKNDHFSNFKIYPLDVLGCSRHESKDMCGSKF